jgi:hypothetical protein
MVSVHLYGPGVAKVEILAKSLRRLRGLSERQPLAHVQHERPVRIHVRPQQGRQGA